MTVTACLYLEGVDHERSVTLEPGMTAALDEQSLLWIDVSGDEPLETVTEATGLQGLAMPGADDPTTGIRFTADTVRLRVTGLEAHERPGRPVPRPLHLATGRNVVVSLHPTPIAGLAEPIAAVAGDRRFGRLDAASFTGLLLDGILGGYLHEVEDLERDIDAIDDRALRREPTDELVAALVGIRHRIAVLRRALAGQREVFAALVRPLDDADSVPLTWAQAAARLERTLESVEHARELLLGSFDIVMTRTAQRTNDVMRVLTVVSAVLLPAGVIAGVMGMNFHPAFFDEPGWFFVVVLAMIALAVATLVFARARRWL